MAIQHPSKVPLALLKRRDGQFEIRVRGQANPPPLSRRLTFPDLDSARKFLTKHEAFVRILLLVQSLGIGRMADYYTCPTCGARDGGRATAPNRNFAWMPCSRCAHSRVPTTCRICNRIFEAATHRSRGHRSVRPLCSAKCRIEAERRGQIPVAIPV